MANSSLVRVSYQTPCPICGKPDWCSFSDDGAAAVCMRVAEGSVKETRNGGYLHRLQETVGLRRRRVVSVAIPPSSPFRSGIPDLANYYCQQIAELPDRLEWLADNLGLPAWTLRHLQVGWSQNRQAYSFSMKDAIGTVIGIRLRRLDSRKYAIRGSRNGCFIPTDQIHSDRLLICEGPTDCAALLSLGFWCIGRPDCISGGQHVVNYVRKLEPKEAVVIADRDEPGLRGARVLASELLRYCAQIRLIQPPGDFKDARAWITAGGSREDVERRIESSPIRTLQIRRES